MEENFIDIPENIISLLDDYNFRDCRIADSPFFKVNIYLAERDILRLVARSNTHQKNLPNKFYPRNGFAISMVLQEKFLALSEIKLAEDPPFSNTLPCIDIISIPHLMQLELMSKDANPDSIMACSIRFDESPIGVLSLESRSKNLYFNSTDIARFQVFSALVAFEFYNFHHRLTVPSRLSNDLGYVLRSAREELKLTQADLADLVGTSRIALSRWESGSQPPSSGQLRRWATAIGLLAGGKSNLIKVVDATSYLLEVLQRDPKQLSILSPEQFELVVADRLDHMGFAVQRTGPTSLKDGGIDIIAMPKTSNVGSFLLAVQAKHHRENLKTGRESVDRLLAWQNTAFRLGLLVTNSYFTRDALWKASQDPARNFLRLRDFEDLARWIQGIFTSEFEWREIPDSIELSPGILVKIPKPKFKEAGIVWPLNKIFNPDL